MKKDEEIYKWNKAKHKLLKEKQKRRAVHKAKIKNMDNNNRQNQKGCYISKAEIEQLITKYIKEKYNKDIKRMDEDYSTDYDLDSGDSWHVAFEGYNVEFKK
jgi:hypothetical protein